MITNRRAFLLSAGAALAAPVLVRASSLMVTRGVKLIIPRGPHPGWLWCDGQEIPLEHYEHLKDVLSAYGGRTPNFEHGAFSFSPFRHMANLRYAIKVSPDQAAPPGMIAVFADTSL